MSINLVTIKETAIAEIVAATGSEQLIDKATRRNFVGLYDERTNWYIPLRANLGKKKPQGAVFDTPFKTNNPHFKRPGLDFQKAIYLEKDGVLPIRNTLPKEQSEFLEAHQADVKTAFERYILKVANHEMSDNQYFMSTPSLFPKGIEKIRQQVEQIDETTNLKSNLNHFDNYKQAVEAAYPDIIGEDGFAEPDFEGLDILRDVDEKKMIQIFSDAHSLPEFKALTQQAHLASVKEQERKQEEWREQQLQEQFEEQEKMDEVYAKATVDGDIRNLKADYVMNLDNQSLLAELSDASNTDLASNVQKWNQKGGAPAVLTTYWNNLSNDHKEEFSQFVKAWKESEVESDTFNGYDTGEIDEIPNFDKIDQKKYQELDVPDERTSQYQELWVRVTESSRDPEFSLDNNFEVNNTLHELQDNFLELEQLQGTGVKRRDELDIPEEFLTMLQDGEDIRKIRVGEAFYTFSIEDQNMDQRGKQKIFLRLNNHDGGNVQEAVFQKIFGTGGMVVNHNFDSEVIHQMYEHPLIGKELHERVQRQLPQTETQKPVSEEPIESESETIQRLHNESKASAVRQADDGKKMFEFQYYDELVPGSYDAEKQTVKINFTARDTITFQPHQFVAEADVLSSIAKGKKVRLSTARFFENNQDILKKLGVLEWRESNKKFKVTLPEDKELVKEKLEASIQSKQSDIRSSNNLEEVAQLSGEIDTLEDQLEIIDTEDKAVSITEEKQFNLSLQELIAKKDLKGIEAHIRDGIDQYLDSDTFKKYLDFACQFRQYSYRNKILIQAQNPKASLVAGYRAWQNKGRQVQRGQKALKIFAPNLVAKKGKDGKYLRDDEGKVIKEVKGYYLTSVYDVRQTEGEPVPKPIYVLEENITNPQRYGWYIAAITKLSPVPIQFREIKDGARGQFIPSQHQIIIQEGMSQSQTIKTMLHEITHAMLHDIPVSPFGSPEYAQHEIEAESVAYMVANSLGIETQEYSFGYLASWADLGLSMGRLEKSLDLICQQAQKMMNELDDILKETPIQEQSQEKEKEKQEAKQTAPRQQSSIKMHM